MSDTEDILLLTYRFPPTGGVGSRRWAKFSKYLSRLGWRLHVVAADFCLDDKVNWMRDVANNENVFVHRVSTGVPDIFFKPTLSLWQRIRRRIALYMVRRYRDAMDLAEFAISDFVRTAKYIIAASGLTRVVVTAPPGSLLYAAALLKIDCPQIQLTLDYRDPWSHDRDFYFPERVSLRKKERIVSCEMFALGVADRVVVVSEDMRTMLLRTYKIDPGRVHVIHNGFDSEDYPLQVLDTATLPRRPNVIQIFYGGVIGADRGGRLMALVELAKRCDELLKEGLRVEFKLFSDLPENFFSKHEVAVLRNATRCAPIIDHAMMVREIIAADVCLSINNVKDPHAFGSKVFDYMALGKPILHISNGGRLSEILGQCGEVTATYDPESLVAALRELWQRHVAGVGNARPDAYEHFSIENLAARYNELLREDVR